jgi:hypothetical protein
VHEVPLTLGILRRTEKNPEGGIYLSKLTDQKLEEKIGRERERE